MKQWRQSRIHSFKNAFSGIWFNMMNEPNFLIQLAVAIVVVIAGLIFKISNAEWLILIIGIGGVLSAEAMNTSVEKICDRFLDEKDPMVKKIKDSSAAAVLLFSLAAAVAGVIIFLPRIIDLF